MKIINGVQYDSFGPILNGLFTRPIINGGKTFFLPAGELFSLNGSSFRPLEVPGTFLEKTDIKMTVVGDYSAGGTTCTVAVRGWIE